MPEENRDLEKEEKMEEKGPEKSPEKKQKEEAKEEKVPEQKKEAKEEKAPEKEQKEETKEEKAPEKKQREEEGKKEKIQDPGKKAEKEPEQGNGKTEKTEEGKKDQPVWKVEMDGQTFYSRDYTKNLIRQALQIQAEAMMRYGNNFMQEQPGAQKGKDAGFGIQPGARQMAAGGLEGRMDLMGMQGNQRGMSPMAVNGQYGMNPAGMGGQQGMGNYPQQMSQYGGRGGNSGHGKTFLGELAYIFSEVPVLGLLFQLLDKIMGGLKNIAKKTGEVVRDSIGGPEQKQPRLEQMMDRTGRLRESCARRLDADQNFLNQAGTYMDAAMGTNYMGASEVPDYAPTAKRLMDPSRSQEFSGFLNAAGGEKTAEKLIEEGKQIREKSDMKKEMENSGNEKSAEKNQEKRQEKQTFSEKRYAKDDSEFMRHNRPTLEKMDKELQKEKAAGRSR